MAGGISQYAETERRRASQVVALVVLARPRSDLRRFGTLMRLSVSPSMHSLRKTLDALLAGIAATASSSLISIPVSKIVKMKGAVYFLLAALLLCRCKATDVAEHHDVKSALLGKEDSLIERVRIHDNENAEEDAAKQLGERDSEKDIPLTDFIDNEDEYERRSPGAFQFQSAYTENEGQLGQADEEDSMSMSQFQDNELVAERLHENQDQDRQSESESLVQEDNDMSIAEFQDDEIEREAEMKAANKDVNAEQADESDRSQSIDELEQLVDAAFDKDW
ncbi:uncharacterized protein LOC135830851 [Sycon ciliatum]|uniref:uncharacterized protein LOC135830851 n=1 Tax=Sycon ciliatum TaxID=27933 RepID=UPI0031F7143A